MNEPSPQTIPASKAFILFWMVALLAIAAFIRVHGAGVYHYSADEAMHVDIAGAPTLSDVWKFAHYEAHPPLLYLLLHYWMMVSSDPAFVRGFSLVFGLLLIPLYYQIGKLINDEPTGFCCAALIAFSNGCIIQSYSVRHYALMLFFVSLSLYFCLLWQRSRSPRLLWGYACFGILACASHFTAILVLFCIAAWQALGLLHKKAPRSSLLQWMLANLAIAAVTLLLYYSWQPIMVPLQGYVQSRFHAAFLTMLVLGIIFPISALSYILIIPSASLVILGAQAWGFFARTNIIRNRSGLQPLLMLAFTGYLFGLVLTVTSLYPESLKRHTLWLLPLVIPSAGWLLADICEWLCGQLHLKRPFHIIAGFLLIGGWLLYDPVYRFSDGSEYVFKQPLWNDIENYLSTLGPRDLIITEKDDGILLANLYPYMSEVPLDSRTMAMLGPYDATHILFNPYYPRNYSTGIFMATLGEAERRRMFDGIDRLVFLRTIWSRSPVTDLMTCDALPKKLVMFPPLPPGTTPDHVEITLHRYATLMLVPKDVFLKEVLLPTGKAHACLKGQYDMVPGFGPAL